MINSTFINLKEEKKAPLISHGIKMFAEEGYDKFSITRYVKETGIAKGSFYQYFNSKDDFYLFLLVDIIGGEKMKYLAPVYEEVESFNFFGTIEKMVQGGLAFSKANPRYGKIGSDLIRNSDSHIFKKFEEEAKTQVEDFYGQLIREGIKRKQLREDLDPSFVSYILMANFQAMQTYLVRHVGKGDYDINNSEEEITEYSMKVVDLLRKGLER